MISEGPGEALEGPVWVLGMSIRGGSPGKSSRARGKLEGSRVGSGGNPVEPPVRGNGLGLVGRGGWGDRVGVGNKGGNGWREWVREEDPSRGRQKRRG